VEAFNRLKELFITALVLTEWNLDIETRVKANLSSYNIGGCLA